LDFIRENPAVCGTVIIDNGYVDDKCEHEYETVVLRGQLLFVETLEEKRHGIETLLNHLETKPELIRQRVLKTDNAYNTITVLKLTVSDMTGKKGK
jgi:nitroimidazol reductase NimA-like FMN-containing flavoprotein (pyridoxamine 5'-phosphate oxidase superfamily)